MRCAGHPAKTEVQLRGLFDVMMMMDDEVEMEQRAAAMDCEVFLDSSGTKMVRCELQGVVNMYISVLLTTMCVGKGWVEWFNKYFTLRNPEQIFVNCVEKICPLDASQLASFKLPCRAHGRGFSA